MRMLSLLLTVLIKLSVYPVGSKFSHNIMVRSNTIPWTDRVVLILYYLILAGNWLKP